MKQGFENLKQLDRIEYLLQRQVIGKFKFLQHFTTNLFLLLIFFLFSLLADLILLSSSNYPVFLETLFNLMPIIIFFLFTAALLDIFYMKSYFLKLKKLNEDFFEIKAKRK